MGKDKIKIILVLALAIILRFVNLNQSFWLDEAAQGLMSQKSLSFLWFGRSADFHPPLFSFLTHFWLKLGTSEVFLRLLPLSFGVVTVILIYFVGKQLLGEKAASLTALLVAISPYHIYYSQEMRMYSLLAFLATASMYFLWQKNWLFYFFSTILLLYTHYSSFFIILTQAVWILFWQRKILKRWLVFLFLSFLLYLPWFPQFLIQLGAGKNLTEVLPGWRQISNLSPVKAFPLTVVKFSLGRISFDNKIFYAGISFLIFAGLGFIFYQGLKKLTKEKIFLLNWFLTPIILCILVSFVIPMYQPFRLLFTIVPFYFLLASGIFSLGRKWQSVSIGLVLLISFFGLSQYWVNPRFQRENWREAVQFIESQDPKNSVAIFEFSQAFAPYQWYSQGKMKAYGVLPGLRANPAVIESKMPEVTTGADNIYLFQYLQPLSDPERLVEGWLKKNGFEEKEIKDFSGVGFVYNYIRR